jgi:hypothetical protein
MNIILGILVFAIGLLIMMTSNGFLPLVATGAFLIGIGAGYAWFTAFPTS